MIINRKHKTGKRIYFENDNLVSNFNLMRQAMSPQKKKNMFMFDIIF